MNDWSEEVMLRIPASTRGRPRADQDQAIATVSLTQFFPNYTRIFLDTTRLFIEK